MSRRQVSGDELDYEDDTLVYLAGERFSGIGVDRRPDGSLEKEIEYRNGIRDGLSRTYWPSGGLRVERWYDYGVKLRDRSWYEDGAPEEDVVVDDRGIRHHYRWAQDGSMTQADHREGA